VGPNNSVKPFICVQNQNGQITLKLAPGQSGDANKASGNEYYVGATIRFDGCEYNNVYLGYIGFSLSNSGNNAISGYTPPEGVHIAYEDRAIDSQGHVTGAIRYTPIAVNHDLPHPSTNPYWQFAGINLSGLEFNKVIDPVVIPNLSVEDEGTKNTDLADTKAFINAGVNTVRVPISWGFIQLDGPGKGSLNLSYYDNYLRPLLQSLTEANVYAMIDLHAYMRYSEFGKQYSGCGAEGACPDGTLITDEKAYQSVWGELWALIQKDPAINKDYIMFDLVNEPVDVPDDKVFTIQASVIKMLREQHFDGYILVEGNSWSGLHSWASDSWKGSDGQSYTNATLFTRENFEKAGITDLSKVLINVHQYLDSNYSGNGNSCQQDLTTTGPNGFNLNAFVDYLNQNKLKAIVTEFGGGSNAESCREPLRQFMQYLQDNSANNRDYGFTGWTIWSTGHGWGGYNLRVKPDSYHMGVLNGFLK
jgi:endoglucanase